MEYSASSLDELKPIAQELATVLTGKVWLVEGEMGAGKTTFIKALCQALGITDNVSSPTFSLVNEYRMPGGSPVFHFDFYRIQEATEALDMGVEEYFDSGNLCLVEWADRVQDYLPDNPGKISIVNTGERRLISVQLPV